MPCEQVLPLKLATSTQVSSGIVDLSKYIERMWGYFYNEPLFVIITRSSIEVLVDIIISSIITANFPTSAAWRSSRPLSSDYFHITH